MKPLATLAMSDSKWAPKPWSICVPNVTNNMSFGQSQRLDNSNGPSTHVFGGNHPSIEQVINIHCSR